MLDNGADSNADVTVPSFIIIWKGKKATARETVNQHHIAYFHCGFLHIS